MKNLLSIISIFLIVLLIESSANAQTIYTLGTGTDYSTTAPINTIFETRKTQYLIRASELTELGATTGAIEAMALYLTSQPGRNMNGFHIKMMQTNDTVVTNSFNLTGLELVYSRTPQLASELSANDWRFFEFDNNFFWDGISNLFVEICFDNSNYTSGGAVRIYTPGTVPYNCVLAHNSDSQPGCSWTGSGTKYTFRPQMQFKITTLPDCSTLGLPVSHDTTVCMGEYLTWHPSALATGYKLYLGTDGNGNTSPSSILNGVDLGTDTAYQMTALNENQTYYWQVVPYNTGGDALSCSIDSFETPHYAEAQIIGNLSPSETFDQIYTIADTAWVTNYTWSVQNGNILGVNTEDTVSINWPNYGLGTVTLVVSNIFGCTDEQTIDINIQTIYPSCATLISPSNTDTSVCLYEQISWTSASLATGYYLYLGTDGNGLTSPSTIANGIDLGDVLSYQLSGLTENQIYYWQIVPYNSYGTASNCSIGTFETGWMPDPQISGPTFTLVGNSEWFVANDTASNHTITWSVSGADILIHYQDSLQVNFPNYDVAYITLVIENEYGCVDSTTLEVIAGTDQIDVYSAKSNFIVFPNPSNGTFSIAGLQENETIDIYDATGRKLETHLIENKNTIVSIAHLQSGLYYIRHTEGLMPIVKH